MNNKFLMLVATISGGVVILGLLLFPLESRTMMNESQSVRAIGYPNGGFLLLFGWLAGGCAAMLFLKLNARVAMSDQACRVGSLIGFKLLGFFLIALLISGTQWGSGWGFGFWLAFLASIVGAFAVYLTFNPALAQKIAEAARSDDAPADPPPDA